MSDKVRVYESRDGDWRWTRYDAGNNETLSESSEGFTDKSYAIEQAKELNPDIEIEVLE
jgi:uncharacterized protein YegP (UPF0339 family)